MDSSLCGNIIKAEYVIKNHERVLTLECISERDKAQLDFGDEGKPDEDESSETKRQKLSKRQLKKLSGQNKTRKIFRPVDEGFCNVIAAATDIEFKCTTDKCRFSHDRESYVLKKPPPLGDTCYVYSVQGFCPRGLTCRYGGKHLTEKGLNIIDKEISDKWQENGCKTTSSVLSKEIQKSLWKRTYDFSRSENAVKEMDALKDKEATGPLEDSDLVKFRPEEKKKIDWRDKLYLSPLTTVGNLPFRRICVGFGADITCGEMAVATPLVQGVLAEWALVRRHHCEKIFGAQLCGSNSHMMSKAAQLVQEVADVDFIDINVGCPIDLIYREGAGSGLLQRKKALKLILGSMSLLLDIPVTVKTRVGVAMGKNIAHHYMPMLSGHGASLITVHGRSREQRYTKEADWDYIQECAKLAKPTPVFGNGDILSYDDYLAVREKAPDVAGAMIGRGALIKPWIFQEIKENRHLDPSSSERLEYLKTYTNYGLEHWGSDTRGVETTRRFLLEWLSFLHRYIPTGLLVHPPQKVNQRPPFYQGRDELETLMASSNSGDWIKISEMLLGPVPEGFSFLPKHKANAWK